MSEKNDFIQLPPIKKDTPSEVVSMIWQYLKLPEESRKRVTADLIDVDENCERKIFRFQISMTSFQKKKSRNLKKLCVKL